MLDARQIIAALQLRPHPIEGGFFCETYRSGTRITAASLPPGYAPGSERSLGTAIYYLLTRDTFSELHRLPTEEVFHHYVGGPVLMLQLFPDGTGREVIMGHDILAGQQPQLVVPAGAWQGSRLEAGADYALLGATMAPGFDYADYESARRLELIREYPKHAERIRHLTHEE
jgi:predicted cupin superfamily sugar epimerase